MRTKIHQKNSSASSPVATCGQTDRYNSNITFWTEWPTFETRYEGHASINCKHENVWLLQHATSRSTTPAWPALTAECLLSQGPVTGPHGISHNGSTMAGVWNTTLYVTKNENRDRSNVVLFLPPCTRPTSDRTRANGIKRTKRKLKWTQDKVARPSTCFSYE
jgi:hypothetical protein